MWYKDKLQTDKTDGIAPFLKLFKSEEEFMVHFFENVKFIKKEHVESRAKKMLTDIKSGSKLPVRYSMKTKDYYQIPNANNDRGYSKKTFKNKKEAREFAEKNILIHAETKIPVAFDSDGNSTLRKALQEYTKLNISTGAKNDMLNYVISHVWGNTENPYFFSSLWNIVIVPEYLNYIMDKPDTHNKLIGDIQLMVKAVCILLYNPNKLMNKELIQVNSELNGKVKYVEKLLQQKKLKLEFLGN